MKKMHSKNINYDKAKKLNIKVGSALLSIAILSGAATFGSLPSNVSYKLNKDINHELSNDFDNNYSLSDELPEKIKHTLDNQIINAKIGDEEVLLDFNTYADLHNITSIEFKASNDYDYTFLNYIPNLKNLIIEDSSTDMNIFNNVDGSL